MAVKCVADEQDENGKWTMRAVVDNRLKWTRSGIKWEKMVDRCRVGGSYQRRVPAYVGCKVDQRFMDFQFFTEWMREQKGYNNFDYELDKDLIVPGNRIYSPETCVLVPRLINSFLVASSRVRGYSERKPGRFEVSIRFNNKAQYLGTFDSAEEAAERYHLEKIKQAYQLAEMYYGKVDLRVIAALTNYQVQR